MELIPILSLIVLVATISTFILAIGAYVLYKVRESKGRRAVAPMPQMIEAELYAPQAASFQEALPQQAPGASATGQRQIKRIEKLQHEQSREQKSGARPAYAQERASQASEQNSAFAAGPGQQSVQGSESEAQAERSTADRKFMKITSEGYVPVSKATKTGDNLRWR